MTIFGKCYNVLNNNAGYLLTMETNIQYTMTIFGQCYNVLNNNAGYLLTMEEEYTVHHDHIWAVLQCVE